jgi:hypothetical protein
LFRGPHRNAPNGWAGGGCVGHAPLFAPMLIEHQLAGESILVMHPACGNWAARLDSTGLTRVTKVKMFTGGGSLLSKTRGWRCWSSQGTPANRNQQRGALGAGDWRGCGAGADALRDGRAAIRGREAGMRAAGADNDTDGRAPWECEDAWM